MAKKKIVTPQTKKLKKAITKSVADSEKDVDLLVSSIKDFLGRNLKKTIKGLKIDDMSAKERAKALSSLEDAMKEAGLDDALNEIDTLFGAELMRAKELYKDATGKRALLTKVGKEDLDAITSFTFSESSKVISNYIDDIRTEIIQGALGESPIDVLDIIDSATNKIASLLKTEWNTSLQGYSRLATNKAAEEAGIEKFIYLGPLDDVTRPFCEPLVDAVFTADEIAEMDNGQLNPVSVYGGGYNCRHKFYPWTEELEQDGGEDNEE